MFHVSKWKRAEKDVHGIYFDDNRVVFQYGEKEITYLDFTPKGT